MNGTIARGDTFLITQTGPSHDPEKGHLFIVLTNICSEGFVLLAPVRSVRGAHDRSCLLGQGDHPFLHSPSWVSYAQMRVYKARDLEDLEKREILKHKGPLDERVLALVCAGVTASRFSAPRHQGIYDCGSASHCRKCLSQ